jgi:pyruvate formate lyase activating enzyme
VIEGKKMSADEVVGTVLKDKVYYDVSGGGVTITGGEPLSQPEFTIEIARKAHEAGLRTAIESSAYTDFHVLDELRKWVDLFLLDIKAISPLSHREWTGVHVVTILENIKRLSATGVVDILVRIPLIPGYTATADNLEGIAKFLAALPRRLPCELLNFNPLARNKYRMLGRDYALSARTKRFDTAEMEAFTMIFRDKGLVATWS